MGRSILLWTIALLVTLASAYWQRRSGPSYPVDGTADIAGTTVRYSLDRTHAGDGDQSLALIVPNTAVQGRMMYRRLNSADAWKTVALRREGDRLTGAIPHQPPAGKVEYTVELAAGSERVTLSDAGRAVVTRFRGDVPAWILIPHVVLMFIAMLFSMRAGVEAFSVDGSARTYTIWTISLLFAGGLILGPLVQKYAFGEYWTGVPFGTDLTDNKTLIAFVAWAIALVAVWNSNLQHSHPGRRWYVVGACVVTLVVFAIPHSMWGSELKHDDAAAPVSMRSVAPPSVAAVLLTHGERR